MLSSFEMKYKDTAVIVASGSSLSEACLELLRCADATIIAVNGAVKYVPFADIVFTLDTVDLRSRFDLPDFKGQKIAAVPSDYGLKSSRYECDREPAREDVMYIERVPFSIFGSGKIMAGCSGFGALQLATQLGVKRVFLFGCDHSEQGKYFYDQSDSPKNQKQLIQWENSLEHWQRYKKPDDVEVINCSLNSRIKSFPKMGIPEAFAALGLPMLPVVTVLKTGGEYNESHVEWLRRQIGQPLICLTDSLKPMTGVISIPLKYNWRGWWSKMEMFRPDIKLGNFLYTDLDAVFLDGVPKQYRTLEKTHVLSDMYGQEHINSGLMFLMAEDRAAIWKGFINEPEVIIEHFKGGDQEFIDGYLRKAARWQDSFRGEVVSYKANVLRGGFRGIERVVCFHGQPRPWDVKNELWIPRL